MEPGRRHPPGLAADPIVQPRYAKPYALRLEAFPASFQAEVEAWLRRLACDGPLDEGPLRPLRPRSLEQRRFYLRQAASALVQSGRDPATITGLADLVTVEAMQAILRFFLARSGNQPTSQIHGLATHLKAIARHHVGATPAVLEQLGRMVRRVAPPQTGMALKNRLALKQLEDPELLRAAGPAAGQGLRHPAAGGHAAAAARGAALPVGPGGADPAGRPDPAGQPRRARARPASAAHRHRQAAALPPRDPGEEVKNGQPIELPLPAEASALLELYRTRVRPVLAPPQHQLAVPGRDGAAKALVTLGGQISRFSSASSACGSPRISSAIWSASSTCASIRRA